jgi:DNA-binding transcriptional LysR family regulator
MELRHLRYFVAIGEEQHYGRAARSLRVAQPALSRQIQDLEKELGFKLFERLPRGVKLSTAGKLFLEDARRILQDVSEATARADRVARGHSGTLRVGFAENASWHGIVPDSLRRFREQQPDAELQLQPAASSAQLEAIRSVRLDAGFVQEGPNEATILSLVSTGLGVGWVLGTARWRCPKSVVLLPVTDLKLPLPLALAWRKDNTSPLLAKFVADVRSLPEVKAPKKG